MASPFNSYVIWHKLPPLGLYFCVCKREVMIIGKMKIISKVVSIRRQCLESCFLEPSTAVNTIDQCRELARWVRDPFLSL